MKVLIASDTFTPTVNGVVTSVVNLREGLEALGHEVRIITLSLTTKNYKEGSVYYIGSCDISHTMGVRVKINSSTKFIKEIIEWKPDIIHTQSEFSSYIFAKKIAKKLTMPVVHTYHTMYEDYTHYFSPSKRVGIHAVKEFIRFVSEHVDEMIVPTTKISNIFSEYNLSCPVTVIPTGINLKKFDSKDSDNSNLKSELGITENDLVMVSVGRVSQEKNIEEIIRYIKEDALTNVKLIIVGDGPQKEHLEEIVKDLEIEKYVKFTGMIDHSQVQNYYRIADIFVSASKSETQGLTYIEALASGTPILCKTDDCLIDVLEEGKNGFSFNDAKDFSKNLEKFRNKELLQEMSTIAKESTKKFDKDTFAKTMQDFYTKAIDEKEKKLTEDKKNNRNRKYPTINRLSIRIAVLLVGFLSYVVFKTVFLWPFEKLNKNKL